MVNKFSVGSWKHGDQLRSYCRQETQARFGSGGSGNEETMLKMHQGALRIWNLLKNFFNNSIPTLSRFLKALNDQTSTQSFLCLLSPGKSCRFKLCKVLTYRQYKLTMAVSQERNLVTGGCMTQRSSR